MKRTHPFPCCGNHRLMYDVFACTTHSLQGERLNVKSCKVFFPELVHNLNEKICSTAACHEGRDCIKPGVKARREKKVKRNQHNAEMLRKEFLFFSCCPGKANEQVHVIMENSLESHKHI